MDTLQNGGRLLKRFLKALQTSADASGSPVSVVRIVSDLPIIECCASVIQRDPGTSEVLAVFGCLKILTRLGYPWIRNPESLASIQNAVTGTFLHMLPRLSLTHRRFVIDAWSGLLLEIAVTTPLPEDAMDSEALNDSGHV